MHFSKLLVTSFLIALLLCGNFIVPLTYAYNTGQANVKENEREEMIKHAFLFSALRREFFIPPIPAISLTEGTVGINNKAKALILAFPAKEGVKADFAKVVRDTTLGIFLKLGSGKNLGEIVGEVYKETYESLMKNTGIKLAFLPYENMSFTFMIILWIETENLNNFLINLGVDKLKVFADNIILVFESLTDELITTMEEKSKESSKTIFLSVRNEVIKKITEGFDNALKMIDGLNCQCVAVKESSSEIIQNCAIDKFILSYHIELRNGKLNSRIGDVEYSSDFISNTIVNEVSKIFREEAHRAVGNLVKEISSKKDSSDLIQPNDDYQKKIVGLIHDEIKTMLLHDLLTIGFVAAQQIVLGGTFNSCDVARESLKQILISRKNSLIEYINKKFDIVNASIYHTLTKAFDYVKSTIKEYISNIREKLNRVFDEEIKDRISDQLKVAVKSASPVVLAVYSLGEGLFQATQTLVTGLDFSVFPYTTDDIDSSVLICRRNGQNILVRLPSQDDEIRVPRISTSLREKVFSAAKGFIAGLLDATIGSGARRFVDAIPVVFVVNAKMEMKKPNGEFETVVAPSMPGIYTVRVNVKPITGLGLVKEFADKIKETLFGSIKSSLYQKLSSELDELRGAERNVLSTDGLTLEVPFPVLTPYFVVESVRVNGAFVEIKFAAIYDFASIFRAEFKKFIKNFESGIKESLSKIEKSIKDFILNIIIEKVFDRIKNYILSLIKRITNNNNIITIVEKFLQYIKDNIIKVKVEEFINNFINYIYREYLQAYVNKIKKVLSESFDLFDTFVTTILSLIKVRIFNAGRLGVVVSIPKLGIVSSPIDDEGYVTVSIPVESLAGFGVDALSSEPLYSRLSYDGSVSLYKIPWAKESPEPIVAPLIPVSRIRDNALIVRFVTPFHASSATGYRFSVQVELLVDGKPISRDAITYSYSDDDVVESIQVNLRPLRNAGVVTLRFISISIHPLKCKGALVPSISSTGYPILINISRILKG